jgi:betaine-aldehyde dehydrogenase
MTTATAETAREHGHLIAGERVDGETSIERRSPGGGELVARFAEGTAADVEAAVAAARDCFDSGAWPGTSGAERARVLLRAAAAIRANVEQLARIDALEVGKPLRQARGDVEGAAGHFEYASALAHEIRGDAYTNLGESHVGLVLREPLGVAGLIIPWNFPGLIFGQKVPYALAAGCTTVVKPSEFTSGTALEMARLVIDAGVPAGAVNVVTGYGAPVGQALVESRGVDFVSFTGSTLTGEKIAAAAASTQKRVSLELGGKGASIVFADADLDDAVDGTLFAVFFNTGECCVSGSRLLVEDSIAGEFLGRLVEKAERLSVGAPLEDADIGALIHEGHLDKVLGYVAAGEEEGARLLTGGRRAEAGSAQGLFVEPTIFDAVEPGMRIFREEIFGPVLSATRFTGVEEAIAIANQTEYGLGNTVWTKNVDTAVTVSRALRSGTVWVNTTLDSAPQMPFGGVKASGYGREMGRAGLEEYTELKSCVIRTGKRTPFYG